MDQFPQSPPPTPPSCSDCTTKVQPAGGGQPSQSASRMWRSSDGKTRLDTPHTSVISDPASGHTILLDHLKKEATILPMTALTAPKAPSGVPHAPAGVVPPPPPMHVEDLGKSMIEGHEVEGKRFTLPALAPPPKPQMPKLEMPKVSLPGAPQMPKPPAAPKPPELPEIPPKPNVTEVWSSVKLKTPVLTKVSTAAGEQTTYCKPTSTEEPHPSVFQIPQGYKIKPPKL